MSTVHSIQVVPRIPAAIGRLDELVANFWFSWSPRLRELLARLDPELWLGVALKPEGAHRNALAAWLEALLAAGFEGRILPFDAAAARVWGHLMAEGRRTGRPPAVRDAEIAAVALARGLTVATRNIHDFEAFGVPRLDPWQAGVEPQGAEGQ